MSREELPTIFIQVLAYPKRKAIFKRAAHAYSYQSYVQELGLKVWEQLCNIKEALYEPVGMWLPPPLCGNIGSRYVQAVEVPVDYSGSAPEGFEQITLPRCTMMLFQTYSCTAGWKDTDAVSTAIAEFNPGLYGYHWDNDSPSIQLKPCTERGYIEGHAVNAKKAPLNNIIQFRKAGQSDE